jgi:hypothetical protein
MTKRKTFLSPENQWDLTAAYYTYLNRSCAAKRLVKKMEQSLIIYGTHSPVKEPDILIFTAGNGMLKRYGMTGVTSKGARLNNYYLPLRHGYEVAYLPDDFIGLQWNDPGVGRYVADLRASFRSRVSANSPATSY